MSNSLDSKLSKKDLEELLSADIKNYQVTNLTQLGDNKGSCMLAVKVILKTGEVVYLAAKTFPEDPRFVEGFQCPITTCKEIGMYKYICPEFQKIQEEHAIPPSQRLDMFCKCLAARTSRHNDGSMQLADESSVILMENLKVQGYTSTDRIIGMDLVHTEMVLTHLAKFHATIIAMKLTKPTFFKGKVLNVLTTLKFRMKTKELEEINTKNFLEALRLQSPVCEEHFDKLTKVFYREVDYKFSEHIRPPVEPFATIVHNDLWTNNFMFKYSSSSSSDLKPVALKLVDFQATSYGTPATDIVFFLFTSTRDGIVAKHLEHLLRLYHDNFVQWLSLLGCNTEEFSWENFTKELSTFSSLELPHILFMLNVVMAHKDQIENKTNHPENAVPKLNDDIVQRAAQAVSIFSKKGWI